MGDTPTRLEAVELKLADINSEYNKARESDVHTPTQMHFSMTYQISRSIGRRARSLPTDMRLGLIRDQEYQHGTSTLVGESQRVARERTSNLRTVYVVLNSLLQAIACWYHLTCQLSGRLSSLVFQQQ